MGGAAVIHDGPDRSDHVFLVAGMKGYALPFLLGLIAFGAMFFLLDFSIMKMMGLTLLFQH